MMRQIVLRCGVIVASRRQNDRPTGTSRNHGDCGMTTRPIPSTRLSARAAPPIHTGSHRGAVPGAVHSCHNGTALSLADRGVRVGLAHRFEGLTARFAFAVIAATALLLAAHAVRFAMRVWGV